MVERRIGDGGPAQHAGDFLLTLVGVERVHLAANFALGGRFGHANVVTGAGCYLGQVGNGQYLAVLPE